VLTRHLMEPNKYVSWTLLLGLWAPGTIGAYVVVEEATSNFL